MKINTLLCLSAIVLLVYNPVTSVSAESASPQGTLAINIWPGKAPGEICDKTEGPNPSKDDIIRLANVSTPSITIYKAEKTGSPTAAVVVCPGGGYSILAMNLEGTEIATWLNSIGVTAVLLKYRVPNNRAGAFMDVQRAVRLARKNAKEWNIDPDRIGIIGFSAGGHLSAHASTGFEIKSYDPVDDADQLSCRPDFAMLIYPAYLVKKDFTLSDELPVNEKTPRTILVQAQDDGIPVENAIYYYLALKKAKVPSELHIFPTGGHGYGLRPSKNAVSSWPKLCETWMGKTGMIKK